jgi:hypothetical protein
MGLTHAFNQRSRSMTLETLTAVSDTSAVSLPVWLSDAAAQPAEEHRSCTTPWDTTKDFGTITLRPGAGSPSMQYNAA